MIFKENYLTIGKKKVCGALFGAPITVLNDITFNKKLLLCLFLEVREPTKTFYMM